MPAPVHVSTHPLIQHKLARLRAVDTKPPEFRDLVSAIARGLFFEVTRDLRLAPVAVQTPLTQTTCQQIADRVGLVPVLRAGLGMADAMLEALPEAAVWHLGLYRDHATLKPVTYYNKLPPKPDMDVGIVLDPMLATGGSLGAAITFLFNRGAQDVTAICLLGAPEGVAAIEKQVEGHDVTLVLGALDERLNEKGYIVPGLGDAGDRLYGTA